MTAHHLSAPSVVCTGCPDRRSLLRGASAAGAGLLLATPVSALAAGQPAAKWRVLCKKKDVPVQGGIFVEVSTGFTVVVTQPRKDLFRCFDARCTHQGCTCNAVRDRRVHCPCHGSQYGLRTGAVLAGPATQPLSRQRIRLRNGNVELET